MISRRGRLRILFTRIWDRAWLPLTVLLGCAVYVYFLSAGGVQRWPVYGWYHDLLADGFRSGHLYIPRAPDPELIAAKNPYDPINSNHWLFDASYFKGKYYVYWGPFPALLQAAAKTVLGIKRSIGDQYVALFFLCVGNLFGALLVERLARRLFSKVPRLLIILGAFALFFANPTLHAVTTAGTYHTAIVSAQTCLLGGLVAAFDSVWYAGTPKDRGWKLAFAGLGFGLALACRITVAPAVVVFCVATLLANAWDAERRIRKLLRNALWLGAPLLVISCALLTYNKLRFESWLEFGTNVMTSGLPPLHFSLESLAHLLPNLYSYMLRPAVLSCQFPYVFQVWSMSPAEAFPKGFTLPNDYMVMEPVVGWLLVVPLTWLIPFALVLVPRPFSLRQRYARTYLWCLVVFSALASATGLIALAIYGATMRYLNDVTFGLVLVALLGGYALRAHSIGRRLPRATTAVFGILACASIVLGMLLGYQGYNGQFHKVNPALDSVLVEKLSVCAGPARVPRYQP